MTGAVAGAIGGWAMSRFGRAWVRFFQTDRNGRRSARTYLRTADDRDSERLVQAAGERLLHRQLTRDELNRAVPVVRYGLGASLGGAYAVLVPPRYAGLRAGALLGLCLWAAGELLRPGAFSASGGGWVDPSARESLASHMVYGITTAALRRLLAGAVC
jgi:hypothetical protein